MRRQGTTLIESVISIFLVAVVVVTFLEALNVGINGTLNLSRKTSALNLAKSQLEWVKAQTYNNSVGNLSDVYGVITTATANISDIINYNISGNVSMVTANQSLQKITVNVSYLVGKQVQLTGYVTDKDSTLSQPPIKGQIVTDVVKDTPQLPTGGFWLGGSWCGYYHVFKTGATGNISATWSFNWTRDPPGTWSAGSPWILIYGPDPNYPGQDKAPPWATRDYLGNVYPDGIICRSSSFFCEGCPPAPNGTCLQDHYGDYAPVAQIPIYDCVTYSLNLVGVALCWWPAPCGQNSWPDNYKWCNTNLSWYDDNSCSGYLRDSGYFECTVSTNSPVPAGTYTVLFFNGEMSISFETISASVTYVH